MTEDANDSTPYNQQHRTDTKLMQKYGNMQGKVVFVSLYKQAIRVYNNGQLVNAFLVTTGTSAHPSLPGVWWVEQKESPAIFKSIIPKGQPGYYPDTPVNYAMLYHSGGYNLHDSWWRNDYGPGTQFPHADSSGNQSAYEGSHGCVNIQKDNARWLYGYVDIGTAVIVY
jgi:lipoprotein-anchoring transpeptidase ErfK/SrfK